MFPFFWGLSSKCGVFEDSEATLPLPMAAPGSFYRWEDVKNL